MDILFTKELIKCTTGLDVNIIRPEGSELLALLGPSIKEVIFAAKAETMIKQMLSSMEAGIIYEISAVLGMCYTAFLGDSNNCVILGPCIEDHFSMKDAQRLLQSKKYSPWAVQSFIEYCRYLPVVSHQKRHQVANLLAKKMLERSEDLPFRRLNFNLSQDEKNRLLLAESYEDISRIRLLEKQQQTINALSEAVKQGNLSLAYSFLNYSDDAFTDPEIEFDVLREIQNNCIVLNTRLQQALESCGIHPYELAKVYNAIAAQTEKLKTVREGNKYQAEIVRSYCALARDNRYSTLSPFAKQVTTYIKNHLSDNISVKSTAAALLMNPDYLSNRFHKESGETFISFLNRERVEQAAVLLKSTDMMIKEIASSVGFNNTSYFAKQFMAFTGQSPREFRADVKL